LPLHAWIWIVDTVEYQSIENVENEIKPGVRSLEKFDSHLLEHLTHDDKLEYRHGQVND